MVHEETNRPIKENKDLYIYDMIYDKNSNTE